MARPLDRNRPLWEMYLVEGLAGGRFAILTKTHHAMVDGAGAIDIGQVILDVTPEPQRAAAEHWIAALGAERRRPASAPPSPRCCAARRRPIDALRFGAVDVRETAERFGRRALGLGLRGR